MAIYRLFDDPIFPDPEHADPDGLLAVGGDLTPERLISAYSTGIFPWYAENSPILWWSTNPRLVLFPNELHVPRRLAGAYAKVLLRSVLTLCLTVSFAAAVKPADQTRTEPGWCRK